MATLLHHGRTAAIAPSTPEADLWVPLDGLEATSGWSLQPEGACRDDLCVPIPRGREAEFVDTERFNLSAMARYLGAPILRDEPRDVWAIGESVTASPRLQSTLAPDFTLPDLDGLEHSLSDYRGRKVFLVSWASW